MTENKVEKPAITVVIPVKNEEHHICQCLNAVCNQTYPSDLCRIVVVDNGSSDNTIPLVKPFEKAGRVQLLFREGGTIAGVRNFGASFVDTRYIAFLDGDCVPAPDWLETGIRLLENTKGAGCVGFVGLPPGIGASWVEQTWHHLCSTGRAKGSITVNWLSSFNLIMRNGLFRKVGGFDETLATCEDADLGYRLSGHAKLILSDESTVCHLDEPKTLSGFFWKELWRGKGNLRNFLRSPQKKKDFVSLAVPVAYCLVFIVGIIAALAHHLTLNQAMRAVSLGSFLVLLVVPLLNVFYKTRRLLNMQETVMSYFLSMVYLIARGLAIVQHGR